MINANTNTEMTSMSELPDKDFKATTTKMIQQSITNSLEANEKMENLSGEINTSYNKKQMELIELKTDKF